MGVAVQSHYFSVGSVVTWARAGVGAVATQAMVDVRYGPLGLGLMEGGMGAPHALRSLLTGDAKPEVRQVAMVDSQGMVGAHTGNKCIPSAGHATGKGFSCQGNIVANGNVWGAMKSAFEGSEGSLSERLMAALEAGQEAGGDLRGKQSTAMLVVSPEVKPNPWEGKIVDLRVEDSPEPLKELRRLLRYQQGYKWSDRGDDLLSSNKMEEALDAYRKAMELVPEEVELKYWVAVSLLSSGRDKGEGLSMIKEVCARDRNWVKLTRGLVEIGTPGLDSQLLEQLR
jgi:uncharacterized Ntn-hydrolase superfamily protein